MRKEYLVSVRLMTFNHELFIDEAIKGILLQKTNFKVEVVIGDDFSTDDTLSIIKRYKDTENIHFKVLERSIGDEYWTNRQKKGRLYNFIDILKNCQGKYIALLDGDDYWTDPLKLQKQVDLLEANPEFNVCCHQVQILKNNQLLDNYITIIPPARTGIKELSKGNYIITCSSVFRNLIDSFTEWVYKVNAMDYPLHLMIAEKGDIHFMDDCMGVYRIHSGGIYSGANAEKLRKGNIFLLETLINHFENKEVKNNLKNQLLQIETPTLINGQVKSILIKLRNRVFNVIKRVSNKAFGIIITRKEIDYSYQKKSYSQCGEDLIIKYIFQLRGINRPSYIDIGANHPYYLNNTAIFYLSGSSGVNIEANPHLIGAFNLERKADVNLNVGVSDQKGVLDFYIINDPTLSTFSLDEANKVVSTGKYNISEVVKQDLIPISEIVEKYCYGIFPDFLSIDVEGLDFEILKSIDYNSSAPKIICVEAAEYSPIGAGNRKDELINFLVEKGYYEYANTNLNAIMVRRDFWFI